MSKMVRKLPQSKARRIVTRLPNQSDYPDESAGKIFENRLSVWASRVQRVSLKRATRPYKAYSVLIMNIFVNMRKREWVSKAKI